MKTEDKKSQQNIETEFSEQSRRAVFNSSLLASGSKVAA